MASPPVLDFDKLLAPIAGDNPAGADLRADPSPTSYYYRVKDARSAARAAERQLLMEGEEGGTAPPDWRPILRDASKVLAEQSKDLEIAAYLVEALVRSEGFGGLRDGFRLVRELVEKFWDGLYPLPDEEGMETRVAPITGLNGEDAEGTLINPITRVDITEGSSVGPFAFLHYQQAVALGQIQDPAARQRRVEDGAVPMEKIQQAVVETPTPFFQNLVEDLTQCQEEFGKMGAAFQDKAGSHAPPTANIREVLETVLGAVNSIAKDKLAMAVASQAGEEAPGEEGQGGTAAVGGNGQGAVAGAIRTREDAFRTLLKVAEYFRRAEPHTPVSFALEQVVRWGRMPLPDLLKELIPDDSARTQFFKMVGIPPPPEGES
ncbi:MAG: type VI secretion system protein TssA [Planctomycetes bacterium]|nr:type VI secretion system protein TssA [Planctomycetota bacterium]